MQCWVVSGWNVLVSVSENHCSGWFSVLSALHDDFIAASLEVFLIGYIKAYILIAVYFFGLMQYFVLIPAHLFMKLLLVILRINISESHNMSTIAPQNNTKKTK